MEVITIEWLFMVIGLLAGALAASGLTALFYHKGYSKKGQELLEDRQKTDEEAVAIITDAIKKGEDRKREILLSVKEEVHKSKLELERDVRERRQELTRERERIDTKETTLDRRAQSLEDREQNFKQREDRLQDQEVEIAAIESQKRVELERVAGLSVTEARDIVLQTAETEFRYDLSVLYKKVEDEARTTAQERAREIVVTTIQRYASDYVSESTVSVVTLPNEEMKGRIIGREGRNIRTIEQLTGVDLIIDDTPEAVILSSFDPVRREIARISIEKLVQDGRIHPTRIEEMVRKATKEVEASMREAGEQVVFDTNVAGIPEEIVHMLGRLK